MSCSLDRWLFTTLSLTRSLTLSHSLFLIHLFAFQSLVATPLMIVLQPLNQTGFLKLEVQVGQ